MDTKTLAEKILQGLSGALASLAPLTSGPWQVALSGVAAAASFAAELLQHDLDPVQTIEEIKSVLPDYKAARDRLEQLIAKKSRP